MPDRGPGRPGDDDVAPNGGTAGGTADPKDERADDGLDLARAARRATARQPGRPAKRSGSGPGGSFRRRTVPKASGAYPDDRDPQLLDSTLERLIASHGWELDLKVQGVFGRWAELVGDEVGAHATPEAFADGKLVVRTDSTAWATQLKLLAPTIVRRLNEELGHGTVVVIEVLGPHLPSWKKGLRSVRDGRGPRDTYG
jgi:predicted nucleic acid-binding Zn ribbon protein